MRLNTYDFGKLGSRLAYRGEWKPYFEYIADCIHRYSSQRDKQKGEAFVHGFTLALTCMTRFYRPISETDTEEGYADIFLCPLLDNYRDMEHSYIVELKYAKGKDTEAKVEQLKKQAAEQVNRYADTVVVKEAAKYTKLHKLVVIFKGTNMVVCEEIEDNE